MFVIYQIIISFILIFSPIVIIYRILKKKEHKSSFVEKFGISSKKKKSGKLIWFHGASVGEILSIVPLIKHYEKDKSISQILITTSTLSSSKIVKKFKFQKVIHQFYPIDQYFITNNFLNNWNPNIAIFIESEIWPSMFKNLNARKIPLILLNARLNKKTYKKWTKVKNFAKTVFNKITIAYPQNFETRYFLKNLKVKNIKLIGNLKFSENDEKNLNKINKNLKNKFKNKKVWVASSTHNEEELFCAKTHLLLRKKIQNLITIIIPRHVHRVNKIIDQINNLNLKISCHSKNKFKIDNTDIYIVDTYGETKQFHKIASTVFLGGSIIKRGGQNPLEAARYGAKILHGPNTDNFKDVYKLLKLFKISKKITTTNQLASSIIFKKNKQTENKIKNIGKKVLKQTIKELDYFINNEFKKA